MTTTKPSPLAVKIVALIEQRRKAREAITPEVIDSTIVSHRYEQWQQVRDANKRLPQFCENVGVFRGRTRAEWFELQLLPPETDAPYEVMLKRYATPGRYWVYAFQWVNEGSGRVIYGAESTPPLSKALAQIATDLDKPQVLDLFNRAFETRGVLSRYGRDCWRLLAALAPRSKSYRLARRQWDALQAKRAIAFNARCGAREALRAQGKTDAEVEAVLGPAQPILS